ncbi:hypothetical protein J6590_007926 [Homalodisca vitripennis]|nr:hypothetical protein J6590_007926 [Homalodisca vitripennis]
MGRHSFENSEFHRVFVVRTVAYSQRRHPWRRARRRSRDVGTQYACVLLAHFMTITSPTY